MGFENLPIVSKVFIISSIIFAVTGFLYGLFLATSNKKENNVANNNTKTTTSNSTNNIATNSIEYQSLNHPSSNINNPPKYSHLNQEYFLTTEMLSNQQALNVLETSSHNISEETPNSSSRSEQANPGNQSLDYQTIEIPKDTHQPPKYNHHTQEYCMTMEMISNQQSSSHNRSLESNLPPYNNNHKPNTR
ncbi:unnamed protein product [Cunninghamella blakesleeana]